MVEGKPVILCVDDEEVPLTLRRLVLEKAGYDVVTASTVPHALEIVASRSIDLVLSDHLMPGATGTELARRIKSMFPELPVVLISGVNEVPADADCVDLFLSKVVGPVTMCENIAMILEGSRARTRQKGASS
jgi:CheY-like chemotaxis protein